MQGELYQNYESSGDDATRSKLRDISLQVLKYALGMVELSVGAHKIINSREAEDFKQKHALEQYLITLRNEFLTQSITANSQMNNSVSNLRNQLN